MKLAFAIFKYFPHGGLQLDFRRMLIEALARGHKVTVVYGRWEGPFIEGAAYKCLYPISFTNFGKALFFERMAQSFFRREKFDLIVGFNRMAGLDVYFAADNCFALISAGKPRLLRFLTRRYSVYERQEQSVFTGEKIPVILYLADRQKKDFQALYHTPEERFRLLPPGIEPDRKRPGNEEDVFRIREEVRAEFSMKEDTVFLIQVCSGFQTKGVDRTLHALRALPDGVFERCKLLVVGRESSHKFEILAKTLELNEHVIFAGGRDDIGRLLLGADLMVHPARNEATGTVLIEAIAAGLPLICSANCGYASYVRESGGVVLPEPFYQNDLNRHLAEIAVSPEQLGDMRRESILYSRTADFYHRSQKALDYIEEAARCMKSI